MFQSLFYFHSKLSLFLSRNRKNTRIYWTAFISVPACSPQFCETREQAKRNQQRRKESSL